MWAFIPPFFLPFYLFFRTGQVLPMELRKPNYTLSLTQVNILTKDYEVFAFFFRSSEVRQRNVREKYPEKQNVGEFHLIKIHEAFLKLKVEKCKVWTETYFRTSLLQRLVNLKRISRGRQGSTGGLAFPCHLKTRSNTEDDIYQAFYNSKFI